MAKVFVPKSRCIFAITIFILLSVSVGLLVFVLKGQMHHENLASSKSNHIKISEILPKKSTRTPSPQTAPKALVTRSTTGHSDIGYTTESSRVETAPWENFRLPKYTIPLHYDLLLHPNIQNDSFTGSVNITLNVTSSTKFFVVHAYRLAITGSQVFRYGTEEEFSVVRSFLYDPHEYFVVEIIKSVEPGIYKISFSFIGSLVGSIVGFYKSRYSDGNNQTRYLATSKFQPTYARRAFPCYDEPSFKSTFTVSLIHEPGYIALSNMPVDVTHTLPNSELLVTKFQTSMPMVTYLACFIVCDFEYVKSTTSAGLEFRVYSAPDQINKTRYALKFGTRVLEYFENYFGIDYPLPKQDMVAIPDFSSGAMEHWGVITFRETNLLYDKRSSSPQNKQRVSTVISHEMTHMWFGNLVTMEWWDDLWLNEGFASYVEYKGVHEQHPEWDMMSQFVIEDFQPVMDLDSTMSSHPIVQPVKHPDEITAIFDDISYGKGASVLRMLEFFVGKDNFQKGISNFLKMYQFKNAITADLWTELSEVCGHQGNHTIASVMKTWTEQMGFPYVSVERVHSNRNESIFTAKQKRFVKNQELYRKTFKFEDEYIWSIPLSYITENGQSGIIWIHDSKETEFRVPVGSSDWIKFNVNQTGYYLVNYDNEGWEKITELLLTNHELLSPADRSNLLFDAFLLAEAGHITFDVFLSMSKYLRNETHLIPWETAYHSFVYLCQVLESTDVNFLLKSYIKDLTGEIYKKLGWKTSENHLDNLLRTTIIGLSCHSGSKECLSDAAELFQNWTLGQEIPSSLRTLVYHYGMSEVGQEEQWNFMWNKYLSENSPSERKNLLYGLAHVRVPTLIHKYLEYATDDQKIRRQDFFTVLNYIAGNPVGRPFVWHFLREKWTFLVNRFTLNDRYLGFSVKKVTSYFTSERELQQMKAFFLKYPDAGAGKRRRQQALENVQNNIKWLKSYKEGVKSWLESEGIAPWYYPRLPKHIVPEHYELLIYPMFDKDLFNGTVAITVSLKKSSDCFIVHVQNLNVTKTNVESLADNAKVTIDEVLQFEDNNYLVLRSKEKLQVGMYKLYFEFEGPFTLSLQGLYKSSYVDPVTMETKYLATTQFETTHARKAFPCFDEPIFKATFSVRLMHDSKKYALSNAPVKEVIELNNDLFETRFEETLPMTTYLLALVVCDFKFKETITQNGVKLRAYATPHQIDKVNYALNTGRKILTYFEKYFDIPFPLKKLDMIAIPDIMTNGMENWGLITFMDEEFLCSNSSSTATLNKIVSIVSHELAHMWFGNLVTMKWWDDLWLNEGFATYIGQKGVNYAEPEFDAENSLSAKIMSEALEVDMTVNSHPVAQKSIKVKSGSFDIITYLKGSAVLGMIENYIGEDFRRGVSAYLKKYAYGNAETDDLWEELKAASTQGLDVAFIMNTWIKQMNFPYITIYRNTSDFAIQQRRFLKDPATIVYSADDSPYHYIWQVPMTYYTSDKKTHQILLNSSDTITLNIPDSEWIKFNPNFTGYYIVNYDIKDWQKFINILKTDHQVFSPSDRINLLFDAFSLANAGHLNYEIPLNMTSYLKNETSYEAWILAVNKLSQIKRYFWNDRSVKDIIKEYLRHSSKNLLRTYGWEDKGDYSEKKLRSFLIDISCANGNQECLITAGNLFKLWMKGYEPNPQIRSLVFKYGLRVLNNEMSWNFMWQKFVDETDIDLKVELRDALISTKNTSLLERFLESAKNESIIRKHEYLYIVKEMAKNQRAFPVVTSFLFFNWSNLIQTYGGLLCENVAQSVFKYYDTEKDLKRVKNFYKKNKAGKNVPPQYRKYAIENILENIRWHKMHRAVVKKWLLNNVYMPWRKIRLPRHITPSKYNIILKPNIESSVFEGEEEIHITISEPTDYVLIHERDLKIFNTELRSLKTGEKVDIDETFEFKKTNFWVINLGKMIPEGEYTLKIKFSGKFAEDGDGVGRYSYIDANDFSEKYLMATKFEPIDARRMFPCFDEPDMKAKFKLTVIHRSNYTALSNMPEESKTFLENDLVQTVFEESVTMSTYLLCCVISDFDYMERIYNGKKIRAYAPSDRLYEAQHGLNLTVKLLEKYEEYFDVQYILPKLDSIAIPDYTVPAMEHWGIITYDTQNFLVGNELTEYKRLLHVDRVIAHELAHQWFGNLVTMKWWNDLWLNEGFSTLIMYMPLREDYPTAEELDVRKVSKMMCTDSSLDSHPIRQNVSHRLDIHDMFDNISYEKGNAVLKMLQYTLKDNFRIGLSNYLKKYAFKNAETKDLWEELSNASEMDLNITEMMNTWTCQMGFPYIELERDGSSLKATQSWFIRAKNDSAVSTILQDKLLSPFGFVWRIPLVYRNLRTGHEQTLWLNEKNEPYRIYLEIRKWNHALIVQSVKYASLRNLALILSEDFIMALLKNWQTYEIDALESDVLKFNPGFVGYYIVKYDEDDYERIAETLEYNHTVFSVTDRYNLLHDAFVLSETDRLIYDIPLRLTKYLKKEKESLPWTIFRDRFLNFLHIMDGSSETVELLKEYVKKLTEDLYDDIVRNGTNLRFFKKFESRPGNCFYTYQDLDFISTIIDLACKCQNDKCLKAMNDELQLWINGKNTTADLRLIFSVSIPHYGNSTHWNILYKKLTDPNATTMERISVLIGLASFTTTPEILRTIDIMMEDPIINSSMARFMFEELGKNRVAVPLVWNYAKSNWSAILLRLDVQKNPGSGFSLLCEVFKRVYYLGNLIKFIKVAPEIKDFHVQSCTDAITGAVTWSQKYEETIQTWLRWNV